MGGERGTRWVCRALVGAAIVLALVSVADWTGVGERAGQPEVVDVPLGPGRTLEIDAWRGFAPHDQNAGPYYTMLRINDPVRQAGFWYRAGPAGLPVHLATLPLPSWPLPAMAAAAACAAGALDLRQRRTREQVIRR